MKTKNILRAILASAFVLGTMTMTAQSTIYVHQKNGTSIPYTVADLDSISFNPLAAVTPDYANLTLNEVNGNGGVNKDAGKYVELYNKGNVELSLEGVTLTYGSKLTWTGTAADVIAANGYKVILGAKSTYPSMSQGLSANNEDVVLILKSAEGVTLETYSKPLDINEGYDAIVDKAHEKIAGIWYYTTATGTPGAANAALEAGFVAFGDEASAANPPVIIDPSVDYSVLKLNEIASQATDWIEIYNAGDVAIDLGGCILQDAKGAAEESIIAAGKIIQPKSVLVLEGEGVDFEFGLSSGGDDVLLIDPERNTLDNITIPAMVAGDSYARSTDGAGAWNKINPTTKGTTNN
ncbi:MAG: lamin tail domain-containing protein [Prevotellaceae bacterium]|jgi:hypothetical protein|nr:lamin tail domain-containing protein [Prevotellaceae bacterium]